MNWELKGDIQESEPEESKKRQNCEIHLGCVAVRGTHGVTKDWSSNAVLVSYRSYCNYPFPNCGAYINIQVVIATGIFLKAPMNDELAIWDTGSFAYCRLPAN